MGLLPLGGFMFGSRGVDPAIQQRMPNATETIVQREIEGALFNPQNLATLETTVGTLQARQQQVLTPGGATAPGPTLEAAARLPSGTATPTPTTPTTPRTEVLGPTRSAAARGRAGDQLGVPDNLTVSTAGFAGDGTLLDRFAEQRTVRPEYMPIIRNFVPGGGGVEGVLLDASSKSYLFARDVVRGAATVGGFLWKGPPGEQPVAGETLAAALPRPGALVAEAVEAEVARGPEFYSSIETDVFSKGPWASTLGAREFQRLAADHPPGSLSRDQREDLTALGQYAVRVQETMANDPQGYDAFLRDDLLPRMQSVLEPAPPAPLTPDRFAGLSETVKPLAQELEANAYQGKDIFEAASDFRLDVITGPNGEQLIDNSPERIRAMVSRGVSRDPSISVEDRGTVTDLLVDKLSGLTLSNSMSSSELSVFRAQQESVNRVAQFQGLVQNVPDSEARQQYLSEVELFGEQYSSLTPSERVARTQELEIRGRGFTEELRKRSVNPEALTSLQDSIELGRGVFTRAEERFSTNPKDSESVSVARAEVDSIRSQYDATVNLIYEDVENGDLDPAQARRDIFMARQSAERAMSELSTSQLRDSEFSYIDPVTGEKRYKSSELVKFFATLSAGLSPLLMLWFQKSENDLAWKREKERSQMAQDYYMQRLNAATGGGSGGGGGGGGTPTGNTSIQLARE
jgi:hypothetical protein